MIKTETELNNAIKSLFPSLESDIEKDNYFNDSFGLATYVCEKMSPKLKDLGEDKINQFFSILNDVIMNGDDTSRAIVITGYFEDLAQEEENLDLAKKYLTDESKEYMNNVSLKYTGVRRDL